MKTYDFNIFKCHVTITIEKREYEVVDRLEMAKDLVKSQSEKIKMEEPERLCFMEAAEKYIEAKRGELKTSTIKGYENIIEHHFNDLWLIWLDKLTEEHIQQAFDNEIEKGLSKKTLSSYRTFVLKVLAAYRPDFKPEIRVIKETADEIA